MAVEEEGEEEVAALLHNYLNMVEVRDQRTKNVNLIIFDKDIYQLVVKTKNKPKRHSLQPLSLDVSQYLFESFFPFYLIHCMLNQHPRN